MVSIFKQTDPNVEFCSEGLKVIIIHQNKQTYPLKRQIDCRHFEIKVFRYKIRIGYKSKQYICYDILNKIRIILLAVNIS